LRAETSLVQFTGQPHNQIYTNLFGKTDESRIGRRGGLFWLCLELISGAPRWTGLKGSRAKNDGQ